MVAEVTLYLQSSWRRGGNTLCSVCFLLFKSRVSMEWCCPHLMGLPTLVNLNLDKLPQACPEAYLLGASVSCQFGWQSIYIVTALLHIFLFRFSIVFWKWRSMKIGSLLKSHLENNRHIPKNTPHQDMTDHVGIERECLGHWVQSSVSSSKKRNNEELPVCGSNTQSYSLWN